MLCNLLVGHNYIVCKLDYAWAYFDDDQLMDKNINEVWQEVGQGSGYIAGAGMFDVLLEGTF